MEQPPYRADGVRSIILPRSAQTPGHGPHDTAHRVRSVLAGGGIPGKSRMEMSVLPAILRNMATSDFDFLIGSWQVEHEKLLDPFGPVDGPRVRFRSEAPSGRSSTGSARPTRPAARCPTAQTLSASACDCTSLTATSDRSGGPPRRGLACSTPLCEARSPARRGSSLDRPSTRAVSSWLVSDGSTPPGRIRSGSGTSHSTEAGPGVR